MHNFRFSRLIRYLLNIDALVIRFALSKAVTMFSQLATYILVGYLLPDVLRGIYFALVSLAAMGLCTVIYQNASRLSAQTKQGSGKDAEESRVRLKNFGSFVSMLAFIIFSFCIFLLPVVGDLVIGEIINEPKSLWFAPWVAVSFSIGFQVAANMYLSFYEGAGYLKEILNFRIGMAFLLGIVNCSTLILGGGLYAVAAGTLASSLLALIVLHDFKRLMPCPFSALTDGSFLYWIKAISTMQLKISLSWVAGYIVFHSPVLLVTRIEGAAVAGELGYLQIFANAILTTLSAWSLTKVPRYAELIEIKDFHTLRSTYQRVLINTASVAVVCALSLWLVWLFLKNIVAPNFIGDLHVAGFLLTSVLALLPVAQGALLRGFLNEPFALSSICTAAIVSLGGLVSLKSFGIDGLVAAVVFGAIANCAFTTYIFERKMKSLGVIHESR